MKFHKLVENVHKEGNVNMRDVFDQEKYIQKSILNDLIR